jgi:2-polyprenyl-6-methoxyphenol hydroxylase-like FAD-dependent oxidoreductase
MSTPLSASSDADFDVVVIGAGAAGSSAASALARDGHRVAIVDFREHTPPEFRAEKIGQPQVDFFESFGLGEAACRQLTPFSGVWVHRFGRIVERVVQNEYASPYADLVNALRAALPPAVVEVIGRVTDVETSADRQRLRLADGHLLTARLLVVATGLGDTIRSKLGIRKIETSPAHSFALGFDIANPIEDYPFPSLVWVDEGRSKLCYLTVFPMAGRLRGNIFGYHAPNDPWVMRFRKSPTEGLSDLLPRLERRFPKMLVEGPVQTRPTDIIEVEGHRQPGVVLIGDAFFVTCPSTGTGMAKALNDVDRLRTHVAEWLATPGMATEKITRFYDDDRKISVDAHSRAMALHERAIRMDGGLAWALKRVRRQVFRRGAYRLRDMAGMLRPSPAAPRKQA